MLAQRPEAGAGCVDEHGIEHALRGDRQGARIGLRSSRCRRARADAPGRAAASGRRRSGRPRRPPRPARAARRLRRLAARRRAGVEHRAAGARSSRSATSCDASPCSVKRPSAKPGSAAGSRADLETIRRRAKRVASAGTPGRASSSSRASRSVRSRLTRNTVGAGLVVGGEQSARIVVARARRSSARRASAGARARSTRRPIGSSRSAGSATARLRRRKRAQHRVDEPARRCRGGTPSPARRPCRPRRNRGPARASASWKSAMPQESAHRRVEPRRRLAERCDRVVEIALPRERAVDQAGGEPAVARIEPRGRRRAPPAPRPRCAPSSTATSTRHARRRGVSRPFASPRRAPTAR